MPEIGGTRASSLDVRLFRLRVIFLLASARLFFLTCVCRLKQAVVGASGSTAGSSGPERARISGAQREPQPSRAQAWAGGRTWRPELTGRADLAGRISPACNSLPLERKAELTATLSSRSSTLMRDGDLLRRLEQGAATAAMAVGVGGGEQLMPSHAHEKQRRLLPSWQRGKLLPFRRFGSLSSTLTRYEQQMRPEYK